jgi:hypothetical protein
MNGKSLRLVRVGSGAYLDFSFAILEMIDQEWQEV